MTVETVHKGEVLTGPLFCMLTISIGWVGLETIKIQERSQQEKV